MYKINSKHVPCASKLFDRLRQLRPGSPDVKYVCILLMICKVSGNKVVLDQPFRRDASKQAVDVKPVAPNGRQRIDRYIQTCSFAPSILDNVYDFLALQL